MEKIISNRIFIPVLLAALLFMVSCKGPHEAAGNYLYYVDYEGLQVIKNPDSTLTLDFEDYLGNPVHMDNIALPDVETELFNENGVVVLVTTAGEVYYTRPVTDGTRTLAVNPQGMAVRHERILGVDEYQVLFVDQTNGSIYCAALIEEIAGQWYATFGAPVNQTVPVIRIIDIFNQRTDYRITALPEGVGGGEMRFIVMDADGRLVATFYTPD